VSSQAGSPVKYSFIIDPVHGRVVLEQDTTVTVEKVRDVKLETGDEVTIVMQARVTVVNGSEVELRDLVPVKVAGVKRSKRRV
jgi:hypothetical protein